VTLPQNSLVPPELARILETTPGLERALLAGGCVRDWVLGRPVHDFDVEVYGLDVNELASRLARWGKVDLVGRSFGVLKLTTGHGTVYDFTLPRRDSKVGSGHRGFAIELDPGIEPREAASRRDFTINAMMYDPRHGELLDFFDGRTDLDARRLRRTSPAFTDDPLRVLRGMQLAGRFGLTADDETLALCRTMRAEYRTLAGERVRDEWLKWAARSTRPAAGLAFLRASGWLDTVPELEPLIGTPQDPEWHPEGDVWTHTLLAVDAMAGVEAWRALDEESRAVLMFATLLHDAGKPDTTREEMRDGRTRITSAGHEARGVVLAGAMLERLHVPAAIAGRVAPLVREHLAHLQAATPRAVRRLASRLAPATILELALLVRADMSARPPRPAGPTPGLVTLLEIAKQLDVESQAPRPILLGRHLLERGHAPGPAMGALLDRAFDAQLNGAFADLDGALRWLDAQPKNR